MTENSNMQMEEEFKALRHAVHTMKQRIVDLEARLTAVEEKAQRGTEVESYEKHTSARTSGPDWKRERAQSGSSGAKRAKVDGSVPTVFRLPTNTTSYTGNVSPVEEKTNLVQMPSGYKSCFLCAHSTRSRDFPIYKSRRTWR